MEIRKFKDTGIDISLLGLGCMRFPVKGDQIDAEEAQKIVDYAYEHGVNYYDTAYMYHNYQSEGFMGQALKKYPRQSLYIATKMPIWEAKTPEDLEMIFQTQLDRLQTDYIDFYLCHALNRVHFKKCVKFDVYNFLQQKRKEGKIRFIGFSFHDTPDVLQEIVDTYQWDFAQIQLNYLDWEFQDAKRQYEILEEKSIPCIIMEPVRGGALASPCEKANQLFLAARPDKSIASWAIRYAATFPNVLTVLSGMSNLEQLSDNINTLTNFEPINSADMEIIRQAVKAYKEKDIIPCTACRYCMDCAFGVDIPEVFKIYNEFMKTQDQGVFIKTYQGMTEGAQAESCQSCGACVPNCPQGIDIPGKLNHINQHYQQLIKQ